MNFQTTNANAIREFDTEKANICNATNNILEATASISTASQQTGTSPNSVSQHRISIRVKVEENSPVSSSLEDNSNGDNTIISHSNNSASNGWPGACIYRCNITADARRYIYNNDDKCLDEDIELKNENETNHLLALRDQYLCPASAFSTNTLHNNQHYSDSANLSVNGSSKNNSLRDDLGLISNSNRSNTLIDNSINNQNNEEKRLNLTSNLDPIYWNWETVRQWLEWTIKDFSLHDIDINRFNHFMGKDLCRMTREDFKKLTNSNNGELLYSQFQLLRQSSASLNLCKEKQNSSTIGTLSSISNNSYSNSKSYSQSLVYNSAQNPGLNFRINKNAEPSDQHLPTSLMPPITDTFHTTKNVNLSTMLFTESSYKGAWGSPSPSPSQGYHHNAITGMSKTSSLDTHPHSHLRNMQDPYQMFGPTSSRLASSGSGQIQLWQFLLELLSDSGNANCITWEGTNGEFKLTDPDEVARRWGERKSKPNMNYDKLSRALRYYYDKNIMTKVHGKRYAYKFDFQGLAQATQPTAADPAAYKAAYQSADLFMHAPPGYPHPGSAAKHLNFAAAVHSAGISPSTSGSIFPTATSYWTSPGAAANLYSNIAAASATHHAMPHHHHPTHVTSHIGSYAHYA